MNVQSISFCWILFVQLGCFIPSVISNDRKLLIISLDAFKPLYLQQRLVPSMERFYRNGVLATRMNNSFPTKTFVNHFSIATGYFQGFFYRLLVKNLFFTGLYPQNHGVTGNELYDRNKGFFKYSYELFHYNQSVLPIWTLNEMQNRPTGVMMWPGSDFEYHKRKCTFTKSLDKKMPMESRVDLVISWLKSTATLVMMYIDQPDEDGHAYGPDSPQVLQFHIFM